MDEKRPDLNAALRELTAEEAADAGPHIGWERLISYRWGTPPVAEREALQEHLSLCLKCADRLLELRDLETAFAGGGADGKASFREGAWESLSPTTIGRAVNFFAARAPRLSHFLRLMKQLFEAVPERVAELTSSLEEIRQKRQAPERLDQTASVLIQVSVSPRFALRGQEAPGSGFLRGGSAVNTVLISAQENGFTAAINLADYSVYPEYRLELIDRAGKVLWTGHRPGKALLGNAGTAVSIRGLGPGHYRLRIEGRHPGRTELLAKYLLAVEWQETIGVDVCLDRGTA